MYTLTKQGEILLQLLKEFNKGTIRGVESIVTEAPSAQPVA